VTPDGWGFEGSVRDLKILLTPDIAQGLWAGDFQIRPRDLHRGGSLPTVKESDYDGTIGQRFSISFQVTGFQHTDCLFAEFILIDVENLVIGQQAQGEGIEFAEIAAEDQWSGKEAPHADLGVLFVRGQIRGMGMPPADIPHNQHVGIIVMAGPTVSGPFILSKGTVGDILPVVMDIAGGPPGVRPWGNGCDLGK